MNTNAVFTNARRRPVRLFPVFDWADEGVLFDPMTPGTPWDDVGENALFEIRDNNGTTSASCGVWWNGLYHPDSIAWNPFAPAQKAANVQIKDGAILELYLDYDGDGGLDVEKSIRDETCYVPYNELRKAKLYAWVERLDGIYTFDVYQNHPAGSPLAIRLVAKKLNRQFFGIEMNEEYCYLAEKRLELAETNAEIQGYADGVFWERNALVKKK